MGLSEEDKKKHPFFIKKRFDEAISEEYRKSQEDLYNALQEFIYQTLKTNFEAHKEKPSAQRVIEGTFLATRERFQMILNKELFWLSELMLQRFDLVKKE